MHASMLLAQANQHRIVNKIDNMTVLVICKGISKYVTAINHTSR